jgi:hypothetical protein
MKTNSFFNYDRFVLLVKQDLMINRNKYLLTFLAFALGLYAFILFQMNENPYGYSIQHDVIKGSASYSYGYMNSYIMVLMACGAFIGLTFSGLGSKSKCISYLLIPASAFEKYVYPLIFRMVFGLLIFTLIFWLDAQLARLTLMNSPQFINREYAIVPFQFSMFFDSVSSLSISIERDLTLVFMGMSLFVMPLFFKKYALIKAIVTIFVVILLWMVLMVGFSNVFDSDFHKFNLSFNNFQISEHVYLLDLLAFFICFVGSLFLLFIGYFKLKEKQL